VRLIRHDTVDSTSERAFAALEAGDARDGDAHVARVQTLGRGRRGRAWHGSEESLLVSFVHRPPPPGPAPQGLTMAAGVALLDTLTGLGADGLRLDWPNDVVHEDAKLAGILTESRGLDPARPAYVVGVGLNVLQRSFPTELAAERPVTSLARIGLETTPVAVLEALHPNLVRRLHEARTEPGAVDRAYLDALGLRGRAVLVQGADGEHAGRLEGLDSDQGVRLATGRGETLVLPLPRIQALTLATAGWAESGRPGAE